MLILLKVADPRDVALQEPDSCSKLDPVAYPTRDGENKLKFMSKETKNLIISNACWGHNVHQTSPVCTVHERAMEQQLPAPHACGNGKRKNAAGQYSKFWSRLLFEQDLNIITNTPSQTKGKDKHWPLGVFEPRIKLFTCIEHKMMRPSCSGRFSGIVWYNVSFHVIYPLLSIFREANEVDLVPKVSIKENQYTPKRNNPTGPTCLHSGLPWECSNLAPVWQCSPNAAQCRVRMTNGCILQVSSNVLVAPRLSKNNNYKKIAKSLQLCFAQSRGNSPNVDYTIIHYYYRGACSVSNYSP